MCTNQTTWGLMRAASIERYRSLPVPTLWEVLRAVIIDHFKMCVKTRIKQEILKITCRNWLYKKTVKWGYNFNNFKMIYLHLVALLIEAQVFAINV